MITQTITFQVVLALFCASGFLYAGIRFLRFPDVYVSMYAKVLESVKGADWLEQKGKGWIRVLHIYVRFMGGIGVCAGLAILLLIVVKLIANFS